MTNKGIEAWLDANLPYLKHVDIYENHVDTKHLQKIEVRYHVTPWFERRNRA